MDELPEEQFSLSTLSEIQVNKTDLEEVDREKIIIKSFFGNKKAAVSKYAAEQIQMRYQSSDYLIDPNKYRFRKVLRIVSLALCFIHKISSKVQRIRQNKVFQHEYPGKLAEHLMPQNDRYLLTTNRLVDIDYSASEPGKVVIISDEMLPTLYFTHIAPSQNMNNVHCRVSNTFDTTCQTGLTS